MFPVFPSTQVILCHGLHRLVFDPDIANDPGATTCRSCLGDEGGFTDWMGRVRNEWQTKLESLDGQDGKMGPLPEGIPETDDFCVPLNELQRSKVCPLFGHGWHGAEKSRCMLSL